MRSPTRPAAAMRLPTSWASVRTFPRLPSPAYSALNRVIVSLIGPSASWHIMTSDTTVPKTA